VAVGKIRTSKPGDMTRLKRALKESGGGDKWFHRVPADDEFTFRLMVEPYEFTQFKQHFMDGKSFPCNEGDCEGCDEGNDVRPVWVAPVVDTIENRVRALQVPKGIVEELMKKADRHGTVLDRDWILIRVGSGKDNTRYELDSHVPKRRDMSIYEEPDIEAMLESQLEEALGERDEEEEDEPPRRGKSARSAKKAVRQTRGGSSTRVKRNSRAFDNVEDEDDEAPPSRRPVKKATKTAVKKTVKKPAAKPARRGLRR
jgi:hypothetical protein